MADTMLEAIASVARRERRRALATQQTIADAAGVSVITVARFERARAWPLDPEAIVNAIAARADVTPQELWEAATHALDRETT